MANVLFLMGIEDSNRVTMRAPTAGAASYDVHGSLDLHLDLRSPQLKKKVLVLGGLGAGVPAVASVKPDVIFNCITDADSSQQALKLAIAVIRQYKVPVINRPVHVLKTRRDDVATALQGIPGLVVPATIRLRPQSHREILEALANGPVRYPAIVRRIGTHGGESMLVLNSPEDAPLLERIACDGSEYYLIDYVDFRDADGLYRKTRLVVIGDRVFARHQLASRDWNVHASARQGIMSEKPELVEAEAQFLSTFGKEAFPPLAARLAAIKKALKLDYFSIDCSLRPNGDMLLFEANASGNVLRQPNIDENPHLREPVGRMRAATIDLLLEAAARNA